MKRIVFAFFLAGFAAATLASNDQPASAGSTASMASANTEGSVWAQDHNFTAPPQ